jgi:hypothetical protein
VVKIAGIDPVSYQFQYGNSNGVVIFDSRAACLRATSKKNRNARCQEKKCSAMRVGIGEVCVRCE